MNLSALVAPLSSSEFAAEYYASRPVFIPGGRQKTDGLFSWAKLSELLGASPLPTGLRVVRRGSFVKISDHRMLVQECRAGATLILDNVHHRIEEVGRLAASLSSDLGEPVSINLYYSQAGVRGFDSHYDTHDVFVLQLEGKKAWTVLDDPVAFPLSHQKEHPQISPTSVYLDTLLQAGNVLYIPRGYWHVATAHNELSVHLTIGVHVRTAVDFMCWVADELRENCEWRRAFPLVLRDPAHREDEVPQDHVEHLAHLKRILYDQLDAPDLLRRYREYCIAQDRPAQAVSLPIADEGGRFLIRFESKFKREAYQRVSIRKHAVDRFDVIVWGRIFQVVGCPSSLLDVMFGDLTFSAEEMLNAAPGVGLAGLEALLRPFIVEGVIKIIP